MYVRTFLWGMNLKVFASFLLAFYMQFVSSSPLPEEGGSRGTRSENGSARSRGGRSGDSIGGSRLTLGESGLRSASRNSIGRGRGRSRN
jgi:hypothetical protein